MQYLLKDNFEINPGFKVTGKTILEAVQCTNTVMQSLPSTLFKAIDYKTTSAMLGAIFCQNIANITDSIVNPIEKGHPDIIPKYGKNCTEEELRSFSEGLEIKCTIGGITKGANLRAGESRIDCLTGITWQAHHREVKQLLGVVWDFLFEVDEFCYPTITGSFYTDNLIQDDWGAISGTTGKNTKVTGLKASGKQKLGEGWVLIAQDQRYINKYTKYLKITGIS